MDVSGSTPPNPPHSTVKPAETRVELKAAPSSSKGGEKNDTAGRGEMHSKKLPLSSSPDSPEPPKTLPRSPSKPTDAGQDEVQPKKPPLSSSLYAPDSTSPAPGRRHSAHTTRKPSPLEMDVETRETSFSADNPLTKERGREGKVHFKGHALAVTAAFRAERLGRNRAESWMQSTANMMGLSAAPSKSKKKKRTTESDSYPNPNLARPWRWLFCMLNIVIAVVSWMPALHPHKRTFWFWIGLRFTFLPFSFLFVAVLIIACPYEGLQPSQIIATSASLAAVSTTFLQPTRSMDADDNFNYDESTSSPEAYMFTASFLVGSLICLLRVREIKKNNFTEALVYHVVLKKLLPLSMSLVLMMLYFISPVGKCLAEHYIWNEVKYPAPHEMNHKLYFVCEDLIVSSTALTTVCVIFFIFAIYITPFQGKEQNSTDEQSNNSEDGSSTKIDGEGDGGDVEGDESDDDDYEVDRNNFIDRLIMFKFPFIQQVTMIGVFVVTTLSLFVYATQTEFNELDEWKNDFLNSTKITGRQNRVRISFMLAGISFCLLIVNASADHPLIQRLANHRFLKKMEDSMSGVSSTELAPFYRRFCVINVFLLSLTTLAYVHFCHFNDRRDFESGRDMHVSHIWFIIIQSSQPMIGLFCSVHFLSRPKSNITIFDKVLFCVPAIQSLCVVLGTVTSEEPYDLFKSRNYSNYHAKETKVGLLGPILTVLAFPLVLHYAIKGRQIFCKMGEEDEKKDEENRRRVFQNHLAYVIHMSIQLAPSILFLWSEIIGLLDNVDHLKKHQECDGCEFSLDEVINLVDCDLLIIIGLSLKLLFTNFFEFVKPKKSIRDVVQGNAPAIVLFFFFAEGANIFLLSAGYGITRDMDIERAPKLYNTVANGITLVTYSLTAVWAIVFVWHGHYLAVEHDVEHVGIAERMRRLKAAIRRGLMRLGLGRSISIGVQSEKCEWSFAVIFFCMSLPMLVFVFFLTSLVFKTIGNDRWVPLFAVGDDTLYPLYGASVALLFGVAQKETRRMYIATILTLTILSTMLSLILQADDDEYPVFYEIYINRLIVSIPVALLPLCLVCCTPTIIKRMERRFDRKILESHCLVEIPSVAMAAIPPIVYMSCMSSICAFVEYEKQRYSGDGGEKIEVTFDRLQECYVITYTIRPLLCVMVGFSVIKGLFGPWYATSKSFKVQVISSGKGLTTEEFLECFLFFLSAGIAIVMFGLTNEHGEEGEVATSAMTVFSCVFAVFLFSQILRIYKFEQAEMRGEDRKLKRLSSRNGGENDNIMGQVDLNPGFY